MEANPHGHSVSASLWVQVFIAVINMGWEQLKGRFICDHSFRGFNLWSAGSIVASFMVNYFTVARRREGQLEGGVRKEEGHRVHP